MRRWKIAQAALGLVFLGALLTARGLEQWYGMHEAATPDASVGRTVPLDYHGKRVFITLRQRRAMQALDALALGAFVGVAWIEVRRDPFGRYAAMLERVRTRPRWPPWT